MARKRRLAVKASSVAILKQRSQVPGGRADSLELKHGLVRGNDFAVPVNIQIAAHDSYRFSGNIERLHRKRVLVDGIDVLVVFSKLLTTYHPLGSEGINASCWHSWLPSDVRRAAF